MTTAGNINNNIKSWDDEICLAVFYTEPTTQTIYTLNAELNPIRHFLALVGAHHFVHVGRSPPFCPRWQDKG
jgi:hypothetical protein